MCGRAWAQPTKLTCIMKAPLLRSLHDASTQAGGVSLAEGAPMTSRELPGTTAVLTGNQVRRWRAFAVLAVSFFMTIADLAIVNVALPTIGRKLHMPESSLQWVVTGYALTFGGFLLLGGRAADLLGRRRMLMTGLFVFTASSLGCGLATADSFLI